MENKTKAAWTMGIYSFPNKQFPSSTPDLEISPGLEKNQIFGVRTLKKILILRRSWEIFQSRSRNAELGSTELEVGACVYKVFKCKKSAI